VHENPPSIALPLSPHSHSFAALFAPLKPLARLVVVKKSDPQFSADQRVFEQSEKQVIVEIEG
jgi:hypothetical protein